MNLRFIVFLLACVASAEAADQPTISLRKGDRAVLTYRVALVPSPIEDAPYYGRSGFIHPVFTPSGKVVTEAFPADHPHQHGLMFPWTTATFEGRKINFWDQKRQQGVIEHARTVSANRRRLVVELRHVDHTGRKPTTVLNETWELSLVKHSSMNVFDLVSTQTCATARPVKNRQYHYGGMAVRGAAGWLEQGASMRTDEGKDRKEGNHSRPKWVVLSGQVEGAPCGIVTMSHPKNFRAPQPVRLHPTKPYFCFAPMVLGEFTIAPGKPYVSRYRFIAFDGEPNELEFKKIWQDFAAAR